MASEEELLQDRMNLMENVGKKARAMIEAWRKFQMERTQFAYRMKEFRNAITEDGVALIDLPLACDGFLITQEGDGYRISLITRV